MSDRGKISSVSYVLLLCVGLSSAGLFLPAGASAEEGPVRRVLKNGMTVILKENRAAPVVSIQVWVKAGSVQETDEEAGVAHVHEHMLFKGTKSRGVGTIAGEVEAAGGQINAYTSWEMTVYYINMASRFKKKGIDILADIIENAAFDEQELTKEIEVIREEIRRGRDMPARMWNASVRRPSPARSAMASPNTLWFVGWPLRRSSSSMTGKSS